MALLAACAASALSPLLRQHGAPRILGGVTATLLLLLPGWGYRQSWMESSMRSTELAAVRGDINRLVPESDCVLSFEPAWLLGANRLPPVDHNRFLAVDPYASQLIRIHELSPSTAATTAEAFATQPTDDGVLESFNACRYVLMGGRGHRQLSPAQQTWFTAHFAQVAGGPVDLWERTAP